MTRAEVRNFIESGINTLSPVVGFGSGRISEFNSTLNKSYPFAWLESLSNNPDIVVGVSTTDNWEVIIHIAKQDKVDSTAAQYEAIVDECDYIAQQLQKAYNEDVSGYNLVTLTGISRIPFIKKHTDPSTGVILSFTLSGPDTTNLC